MTVFLGFAMIVVFMTLIMTKKLSPILALILVPTIFGLFAGAGLGIGDMVMEAIASMSSTAALLLFAIIYFGIMIDDYVMVDFEGFTEVVDAVGGIDIDVPTTIVDENYPTEDYGTRTLRIEEGRAVAPDRPGHGVSFDWEALEPLRAG